MMTGLCTENTSRMIMRMVADGVDENSDDGDERACDADLCLTPDRGKHRPKFSWICASGAPTREVLRLSWKKTL